MKAKRVHSYQKEQKKTDQESFATVMGLILALWEVTEMQERHYRWIEGGALSLLKLFSSTSNITFEIQFVT